MSKKCTLSINGEKWKCHILTNDEYKFKHGENTSKAVCDDDENEIDFTEGSADLKTAIHELTHAYQSYLCLEDTNTIGLDDFFEIQATFNQKYLLNILESALIIKSKLTGEKKALNEWMKIKKYLLE